MDMYIRDIVDSENAELIAKNKDLTARYENLVATNEKLHVKYNELLKTFTITVNSLRSEGITNQEIAEYLHVPVSEIEAIPTSI